MSYIGNLSTHRGLIGKIGEDYACDYLRSIGHSIIARNYRIRLGEIDIITLFGNTVHFVEVKTVQSAKTTPGEHIDHRKMSKMKKLAELYFNNMTVKLLNNEKINDNCGISLDFIGIRLDNKKSLENIEYLQSLEV